MRLTVLLILSLLLAVAMIAFPDIADQALRIEAFGWVFETRQGAFIVALLVLLFVFWLVRTLIGLLLAGPGQIWQTLRMGSRKRREARLRELIAQWIDGRSGNQRRALKRVRGIVPDWMREMLGVLIRPPQELTQPEEIREPLARMLAARIVTDPATRPRPDTAVRRAFLEAWMQQSPGSPAAKLRMADLAEEEGDWKTLAELLEEVWKQGVASAPTVRPRLARAWLELSESDATHRLDWLRKAHRLAPDDERVLLAYGRALAESGDTAAARRLWLNHLEHADAFDLARALLELENEDAMRAYRKLERRKGSRALDWLKAELAHRAGLDGIARETMQRLAGEGVLEAWLSLAEWHAEAGDHEARADCLARALELARNGRA